MFQAHQVPQFAACDQSGAVIDVNHDHSHAIHAHKFVHQFPPFHPVLIFHNVPASVDTAAVQPVDQDQDQPFQCKICIVQEFVTVPVQYILYHLVFIVQPHVIVNELYNISLVNDIFVLTVTTPSRPSQ